VLSNPSSLPDFKRINSAGLIGFDNVCVDAMAKNTGERGWKHGYRGRRCLPAPRGHEGHLSFMGPGVLRHPFHLGFAGLLAKDGHKVCRILSAPQCSINIEPMQTPLRMHPSSQSSPFCTYVTVASYLLMTSTPVSQTSELGSQPSNPTPSFLAFYRGGIGNAEVNTSLYKGSQCGNKEGMLLTVLGLAQTPRSPPPCLH